MAIMGVQRLAMPVIKHTCRFVVFPGMLTSTLRPSCASEAFAAVF